MPQTYASANTILKEVYEPRLRKQLEDGKILWNRLQKSTSGVRDEVGGKYVVFPIHVSRNAGIGARREMEDLPLAGQQGTQTGRVGLKYLYGSIQLSGQALKLADKQYQSFISVLELELDGIQDDLSKDMNRQIYGNGTGAIATTDTAGSVNIIHISSGFQYLQDGMVIDIWTVANLTADTTAKAVSRTITAIDDVTQNITFSGAAVAVTATDVITRAGSANREITGLGAIVNNTGTLYNINPATVRQWKSVVDANGGVDRPLSEGLLLKNADAVRKNGGKTSIMVTTLGVRAAYFGLLTQQRKFVNTKEFTGGFTGLAFTTDNGEIGLLSDIDCPAKTIYGLSEKNLTIYREGSWKFMDEDGNKWYRVPGTTPGSIKDAYAATMFSYQELGTDRRNTHFAIRDVAEAS